MKMIFFQGFKVFSLTCIIMKTKLGMKFIGREGKVKL